MTILTRVRAYLEKHCEWEMLQDVLITHWKQDVNNSHVLLMDATCYEFYIRYPTDVKLLWECCEWIFEKQLFQLCGDLGIKKQRSKYREQKIQSSKNTQLYFSDQNLYFFRHYKNKKSG